MSSPRLVAVLTTALLLSMSAAASAATPITVRDEFRSSSFAGSDGTHPWNGPWIEIGESDGPAAGDVRVRSGSCASGSCLRISASNSQVGVRRGIDLSDAVVATLTYRVASGGASGGSLLVRVSADSGASWSTAASYDTGAQPVTDTVDIGSWAGSGTVISLVAQLPSGWATIDDVTVNADIGQATTTSTSTTTTSPGPTSTTMPATTTTSPAASTTTTTTTVVGSTTTQPVEEAGSTTSSPAGPAPPTAPRPPDPEATTVVEPFSTSSPAQAGTAPSQPTATGDAAAPDPAESPESAAAPEDGVDAPRAAAVGGENPAAATTLLGVAAETLPVVAAQLIVLGVTLVLILGRGRRRWAGAVRSDAAASRQPELPASSDISSSDM